MARKAREKKYNPSKIKREIKLEPKTAGQSTYMELIQNNEITICNGPAGSGKTIIPVGMALKLIKERPDKYKRIVMVRPAVTVEGEYLGYLPGDIEDKMMPFMIPLLDSLKYFLIMSDVQTLMDTGVVEICPISYMRGRTVNNAIIILDEAQNCTFNQMKMIVTRIGFNTKLIIEGDITQSDLDKENAKNNGLKDALDRFNNIEGVGVCSLDGRDIVRSPILNRIVKTYE